MSIEEQLGVETPTAIQGEIEAGRAAKVKKEINKLIKATTASTFDIAELLFEVKSKNYFRDWGFDSFSKYAKSLELKYSKSYYLVRIVENMNEAALTREQYEPIGLAKLRLLSRLDPKGEYNGTPMSLVIRELALKAGQLSLEELQLEIDTILGLTEDESMVWLNIHLKKLARENVIKPALELAKKHIGTVKTDEEGQGVDASDGAALEVICANFLADPNFADDEPSQAEAEPVLKEVAEQEDEEEASWPDEDDAFGEDSDDTELSVDAELAKVEQELAALEEKS